MEKTLIPKEIRSKARSCFECGICTASCPMVELLSSYYNPRSLLQKALTEPEKALKEERLWLCAWCYKCYERCPQGLKPPEIFQLLKDEAAERGDLNGFRKAFDKIEREIPFPTICSYACFHPERAKIANEIMAEEQEKSKVKRNVQITKRNKIYPEEKVAVIGSGPAGLMAACELAENGYSVTIFECLPDLGGMLRKSMPEYRLPRKALDEEIQRLKNLGVEMKTNVKIGQDKEFNSLWQEGYKAIFVAVGAHKSRKLGIEGEELHGVIDALDFLWNSNMQQKVSIGKKIGVIGGGNVAVDAARMVLRQGAKEVTILYRRSRDEMPANPWELKEAEKEGVKIQFLLTPTKILGKEGKIIGLECVKIRLGETDDTNRKRPIPIEGSEFFLALDTVIVAIGEFSETNFLPKEVELEKDHRILINPITMATSMQGVFAGGDTVTGPATVIEAVLAGKHAARSIDEYLTKIGSKKEKAHGN